MDAKTTLGQQDGQLRIIDPDNVPANISPEDKLLYDGASSPYCVAADGQILPTY